MEEVKQIQNGPQFSIEDYEKYIKGLYDLMKGLDNNLSQINLKQRTKLEENITLLKNEMNDLINSYDNDNATPEQAMTFYKEKNILRNKIIETNNQIIEIYRKEKLEKAAITTAVIGGATFLIIKIIKTIVKH